MCGFEFDLSVGVSYSTLFDGKCNAHGDSAGKRLPGTCGSLDDDSNSAFNPGVALILSWLYLLRAKFG